MRRKWEAGLAALLMTVALTEPSVANVLAYSNIGTPNGETYTFDAIANGDLIGYFVGADAGYEEVISVLVNGAPTGVIGLDNHKTSVGASLNFGPVMAGDVINFVDYVYPGGIGANLAPVNSTYTWTSTAGLNSDNFQHIYAKPVAIGEAFAGSPGGMYVGFEDLRHGGDDDYNDIQFLFTNVTSAPEASTWIMLGLGFGGLGYGGWRRKASANARSAGRLQIDGPFL